MADEILKIIELLPKLLIYVLPGLLFSKIIEYQLNYDNDNEGNFIIIYYVIISYLFICIGEIASRIVLGYSNIYTPHFIVGTLIFSIILGYIIGLWLKSNLSIKFLRFINIYRTNNSSIFADIIDNDLGTWVKVYLNEEKIVYYGALREYEHTNDYENTFIVLDNYISYTYDENTYDKRIFVSERVKTKWVAIKVKDINRIEIEYSPESKKLEWK